MALEKRFQSGYLTEKKESFKRIPFKKNSFLTLCNTLIFSFYISTYFTFLQNLHQNFKRELQENCRRTVKKKKNLNREQPVILLRDRKKSKFINNIRTSLGGKNRKLKNLNSTFYQANSNDLLVFNKESVSIYQTVYSFLVFLSNFLHTLDHPLRTKDENFN